MLPIVEELFWLCVTFDFQLTASHIAGYLNVVSDCLSQMNDLSSAQKAMWWLSGESWPLFYCKGHMTNAAYLSLQEGWSVT
jgi:hypothetical protein